MLNKTAIRRRGDPNRAGILRILRERYEAGDPPPSQRELQRALAIGRSTVVHHLVQLDALGLIRFERGVDHGIHYLPPEEAAE